MTKEQLERANLIQACIDSEKRNIECIEQLGACKELIIMQNTEDVKNAIKGMYYSSTNPSPIYVSSNDLKILVDALNKPRHERLIELQKEFDDL